MMETKQIMKAAMKTEMGLSEDGIDLIVHLLLQSDTLIQQMESKLMARKSEMMAITKKEMDVLIWELLKTNGVEQKI